MTIEELALICKAHELIEGGNRHCKLINEAYKLIPGMPKSVTRNNKINAINRYFEKMRAETLAHLMVNKEIENERKEGRNPTGFTFTNTKEEITNR